MKPGKNDIAAYLRVTDDELLAMKRFDYPESFGLGGRIERYKGKRPLQLYQWDIECLIDTYTSELDDRKKRKDTENKIYKSLTSLLQKLEGLYIDVS